ncbi:DUF1540 domain-containing protein [Shouchella clausii]|uniref:DUF1540 domain-containing protein n=2 Tax=Shouchella TaxID=2893057 RepID=Q5WHB5_SHOC1|nr:MULTISPECIES: DUF1540 domain-containing protein [Shouchella]MCM3312475.1 DUF1540 domain-containing protein [Psychrobacillus sp. MER TA 17]ALA51126.1 hypothetical protein DB29_00298 [Shouchella clausii]MBU3231921.1 DUF1540 domain-containing protein [Shouchella clausii]MBU3264795.1 DUF1540 domain-containing protein [Shouchella clausii]MBU3507742.1 DUF1540 domain-containing protein [Shouchella clausii]
MSPIVHCRVSNCTFWAEGNKCGAEEILVETDPYAADYDIEASSEWHADAKEDVHEHAEQSAETCCQTFKPKKEH